MRRSLRKPVVAALCAGMLAASAAVPTGQAVGPITEPATTGATANGDAVRLELPEDPRRPQVYLAYTGAHGLLGATDDQWSFVRANLDGLWGNVVGMSIDQVAGLTRKIESRNLILEERIATGVSCTPFLGGASDFFERVEAAHGDLRYERRAVAINAGPGPDCWGVSGGIATARGQYAAEGFPEVWALYQPQNTTSALNAAAFPTFAPGSSGDVAYRQSDGVVLECPVDACTDPTFGAPFWNALSAAHARGVPFSWYTANSRLYGINSGWLGRIQNTYNAAAAFGLWRPEDTIVIVHNDLAGSYQMLPERNADGSAADTTTGILYWLLRQQPISTLCPDAIAC